MALLDDKIISLAEMAGWKRPQRDGDGAYRIRLEGGLNVAFFSPDERRCVMRMELASVPKEETERGALLRSVAAKQAGICRKRASIVALEAPGQSLLQESGVGDKLIVYRIVDLEMAQDVFALTVRDFLNDAAWWKASFQDTPQPRDAASLFSMPNMFWGGVR